MPKQTGEMTTSDAGRLGIAARIKKHGRKAFIESCSRSGKSRLKKISQERRIEIALSGVRARERNRKHVRSLKRDALLEYLAEHPKRVRLLDSNKRHILAQSVLTDEEFFSVMNDDKMIIESLVDFFDKK